jgi:hypothetical protein
MKQQKQWFVSIACALVALTINSVTWAEVPLDNRLPTWGDSGTKTVDFTNISINYTSGRGQDTVVFGRGDYTSVFSLNSPTDGYSDVTFDGYLIIDAKISSQGVLRSGSTFGFYSADTMFDGYATTYDCDKFGDNCSTGNLVYGGEITAFGWSASQGILEFEISNVSGWTADAWGASSYSNHIMLSTSQFDLKGTGSVKSFTATADGFAVAEKSAETTDTTEDLIAELVNQVIAINIQSGISNSLDTKLDATLNALGDTNEHNDGAALNSLYTLCNTVDAQRGKKISSDDADTIIASVNAIIASIDEFATPCQ